MRRSGREMERPKMQTFRAARDQGICGRVKECSRGSHAGHNRQRLTEIAPKNIKGIDVLNKKQSAIGTEPAVIRGGDLRRNGRLNAARFLAVGQFPQLDLRMVPRLETDPPAVGAHPQPIATARSPNQFTMILAIPK